MGVLTGNVIGRPCMAQMVHDDLSYAHARPTCQARRLVVCFHYMGVMTVCSHGIIYARENHASREYMDENGVDFEIL